ncbi:hypothetical protein EVAR_42809_1 [Eumeta japonica]|uniref:Uncharacterized protein n=1 Tax=Eumeta variegata TaxID=151549 RepID=A0A4C1WFJ6_EUMVA|nr:hypothetical protein EVAR_42809_1 [Eumeta japonica]
MRKIRNAPIEKNIYAFAVQIVNFVSPCLPGNDLGPEKFQLDQIQNSESKEGEFSNCPLSRTVRLLCPVMAAFRASDGRRPHQEARTHKELRANAGSDARAMIL